MRILITGAAGFIGCAAALRLAEQGRAVVCVDNISHCYDVSLKLDRLYRLGLSIKDGVDSLGPERAVVSRNYPDLRFFNTDISDKKSVFNLFERGRFDLAIHFAAKSGAGYSRENADVYISNNIQGFLNIMEAARRYPLKHIVYASSSAVYGRNEQVPFAENQSCGKPLSVYAVSKRTNELTAYAYANIYKIPSTALRIFTVYGPWGRPDMTPFLFAKAILSGEPLTLYNGGAIKRDFTYIDDIVEGVCRVMDRPPVKTEDGVPYALYNIGGSPVLISDFVESLEKSLGKKALIHEDPMPKGEMENVWADCSSLERFIDWRPAINIEEGTARFAKWYKSYYKGNGK
ncbi:MAG: NAD-dependent epimerase/dehydratase family protein [Spirochaetaceae bacterium]|jgi:UDP-glucuronate 4-epimerase|nr:NAD-dependent epimerase/dehydratase family protein [Spirochaetaceae bacterium]